MLKQIIINPIKTPNGYRNPVTGIALRGPLSQFFSALYLKRLDDVFDKMDVSYLRYQDDLIVLCKTKRQLNRCKRRMMNVLQERGLSLSRKKTRIGSIDEGFHFLGIYYPRTQPLGNIDMPNSCMKIVPHARALRKAREQVNIMVADGHSTREIRNYLRRWGMWWVHASEVWHYQTVLQWFFQACWENSPARNYAVGLIASMLVYNETGIPRAGLRQGSYLTRNESMPIE